MKQKKIIFITSGLAMLAVLLIAAPSLAATVKNSGFGRGMMGRFAPHGANGQTVVKPAALGKISAISGDTLTITGNNNTTYTIDATNAKITSGFGAQATTLTIANLTVGEMISVTGTASGSNISATAIYAMIGTGSPRMGNRPAGLGAAGKITAINGNILTITGNKNTTYTVDASSAKITQGFGANAATLTIANLSVGEMIFANGTVSGTNVTATAISVMNNSGQSRTGLTGNFNRAPRVNGKVTVLNGASFTVQQAGRFHATSTSQNIAYIVNTSATTTFTKNGKTAALSDVTTGEMVMVSGTIDPTAQTVSATAVNIVVRPAVPTPKKTNTKISIIGKFLNLFRKK